MRWRRGGWSVVAAIVAIVVAVAVAWRPGDERSPGRRGAYAADELLGREPSQRIARATRIGAGGGPLSWLYEPGVPARRIAGIVLHAGVPVAGARVELRLDSAPGEPLLPPHVTDADGRFDFGELGVASYQILALATGLSAGTASADARDPLRSTEDVVVELPACDTWLFGIVEDAEGGAFAGASVHEQLRRGVMAPWPSAVSGADGRFRVCGADGVVTAEGYESVRLSRKLQPPEGWKVRLLAAAAVEGIVVDEAGAAVVGALVAVGSGAGSPDLAPTVTGEDGHFRLVGVHPGRVSIEARRADLGEGAITVMVGAGRAVGDVTIVTRSTCRRVAGRVTSAGQPQVGVQLLGSRTQADGTFVAPCVSTDVIAVQATRRDVIRPRALPAGTTSLDDLLVEVGPAARITGMVRDDGRPVANARIDWNGGSARADADGRYHLDEMFSGEVRLQAIDPVTGRASSDTRVTILHGQSAVVDLLLTRKATLAGRVMGTDGKPIVDVNVLLQQRQRGGIPAGRTDEQGAFTLEAAPAGTFRLQVPGYEPGTASGWPSVLVPEGDAAISVTIVARAKTPFAITGTVVHADGTPVAGARVETVRERGVTGDDGRFQLEGLAGSVNIVRAYAGESEAMVWLEVGIQEATVTLASTGVLAVTVSPMDGLVDIGVGCGNASGWRRTTRDARVVVPDMRSGTCEVRASRGGWMGSTQAEVRAGETTEVHVVMHRLGTVRGTIVFAGKPTAAGVKCSTEGRDDVRVAPDGTFLLRDVSPGPLTVSCRTLFSELAPGEHMQLGGAELDVVSGEQTVDVLLEPLGGPDDD